MKHIISFSGGAGSWGAAKRVAEKFGTENMILLFADTLVEDPDLYRFLADSSQNLGVPITRIAEGRTPMQVMRDEKIIGNSLIDPCSKILKRNFIKKWLKENFSPDECIVYIGIDWTEDHRLPPVVERNKPYRYEAPLCAEPYITKAQTLEWMRAEGIRPPALYSIGAAHNNCGLACIKAGQAQWELLLRTNPKTYLEWEEWEESMREEVGDHSILKERANGQAKKLTLRKFRERLQKNPGLFDMNEWGGCGCAL